MKKILKCKKKRNLKEKMLKKLLYIHKKNYKHRDRSERNICAAEADG
jgi:hypothetical protein